jgi:transcriptional regulator with XRE-family HTH domain
VASKLPLIQRVGRRVAQLRRKAGLTQEELAAELDCTIQWLSRVETKGENLTLATLEKLADTLGVKPEGLLAKPSAKAATITRGRPRSRR